jgi:hypothetical protein
MFAVLSFVLAVLAAPFKPKRRLEAENAALRHQVMVLRRQFAGGASLNKPRLIAGRGGRLRHAGKRAADLKQETFESLPSLTGLFGHTRGNIRPGQMRHNMIRQRRHDDHPGRQLPEK